jgi:hypothetical protein
MAISGVRLDHICSMVQRVKRHCDIYIWSIDEADDHLPLHPHNLICVGPAVKIKEMFCRFAVLARRSARQIGGTEARLPAAISKARLVY